MVACWPLALDCAACVGWAAAAVGWLAAGALDVQPASRADKSTNATRRRARETVKGTLPRLGSSSAYEPPETPEKSIVLMFAIGSLIMRVCRPPCPWPDWLPCSDARPRCPP